MFNTLPTRFRHYEVQKLLGSGGFGAVYLARDTKLKRLVVLKTLHPHLAAQPDMVRRFLREAQAMARLDHANIVRVNRVEDDRSSRSAVRPMPFFEMEYVEGQTLAQYRHGRMLPLPEAMPILKQMAAALDAAHRQKMVHRDVKPGNVLIKPDGTLKLTDFGIIKFLEVTGTVHPSTGGIIGTPVYMAPEQADLSRKNEIGPATDIYALGVMTYQLLTGHLPFSGGHAQAILYAHANTPPPDPRQFNRYLSAQVAQVLLQALDKQPKNRYPSAMSFVNALEQAALGGTAPPPPTTIPPTAPSVTDFGTATSNNSATIAQANKIPWPMIVGLLILCIIGLLLRPFIFPPDPPPAEPAVVLATEAPIEPTEAPTATPRLGIGSTMPGQDGMTLLYVPAGEFLRGSKEDDPAADDDEHPQRSIYLDGFWIDETEVTNEMFATFLNQQGNQVEGDVTWLDIGDNDALISQSNGSFQAKEGFANHPVIEVTWYGANAYCQWAGRRLPTEAEWEKAARGTEGQTYPWGNEPPTCDLLQYGPCEGRTVPVGSYSAGASPYGALDMAGNVWEWAADWRDAEYYNDAPERNPQGPDTGGSRVLRGGSWDFNEARWVRAGSRGGDVPAGSSDLGGFRCARSP